MSRRGFSFLEIVIAVFLVAIVLVPMVVGLTGNVRATDQTNRRVVAIALTNQALERFKSEPFARLEKLFGDVSPLPDDPTLASELVGEAFRESVSNFHLSGHFEVKEPGKLGVLTIACDGEKTHVSVSKVIADYAKVGFEGEPPPLP